MNWLRRLFGMKQHEGPAAPSTGAIAPDPPPTAYRCDRVRDVRADAEQAERRRRRRLEDDDDGGLVAGMALGSMLSGQPTVGPDLGGGYDPAPADSGSGFAGFDGGASGGGGASGDWGGSSDAGSSSDSGGSSDSGSSDAGGGSDFSA